MRYRHSGNQPVYAPNSYSGPRADTERYQDPSWFANGELLRSAYTLRAEDDDYGQAGTLYRKVLSPTEKDHLVSNIVGHLGTGVERFIQERALKHWYQVDSDLGARIARGIGLEVKSELSASAD